MLVANVWHINNQNHIESIKQFPFYKLIGDDDKLCDISGSSKNTRSDKCESGENCYGVESLPYVWEHMLRKFSGGFAIISSFKRLGEV
jgi:hypothetical protein